jgi:hypothetical protein
MIADRHGISNQIGRNNGVRGTCAVAAIKFMLAEYLWLFTSNELLPQEKRMKSLRSTPISMLPDFIARMGPLGRPARTAG